VEKPQIFISDYQLFRNKFESLGSESGSKGVYKDLQQSE